MIKLQIARQKKLPTNHTWILPNDKAALLFKICKRQTQKG